MFRHLLILETYTASYIKRSSLKYCNVCLASVNYLGYILLPPAISCISKTAVWLASCHSKPWENKEKFASVRKNSLARPPNKLPYVTSASAVEFEKFLAINDYDMPFC